MTSARIRKKRQRRQQPSAPRVIGASNDNIAVANDNEVAKKVRANRAEVARLKAQGAEVNVDPKTKEIRGAWRKDVFETLRNKRGKPEVKGQLGPQALPEYAYDAYRGHERDLHIAGGAGNPDRRPDFIRSTCEGAPGQNVTAEMLDAAHRVRETMKRLTETDGRLLDALMTGDNALAKNWRAVVAQETGESQDAAQAARIRALGANLNDVRSAVKREKRKDQEGEPRPKEPKQPTWFRGDECG